MPLLVKDSAPGRADARIRRADAWQEKRTMVFALGFGYAYAEDCGEERLTVDGKTIFYFLGVAFSMRVCLLVLIEVGCWAIAGFPSLGRLCIVLLVLPRLYRRLTRPIAVRCCLDTANSCLASRQ